VTVESSNICLPQQLDHAHLSGCPVSQAQSESRRREPVTPAGRPAVLFVGVKNSGKSQMAAVSG
jgi:hypothetical protein